MPDDELIKSASETINAAREMILREDARRYLLEQEFHKSIQENMLLRKKLNRLARLARNGSPVDASSVSEILDE